MLYKTEPRLQSILNLQSAECIGTYLLSTLSGILNLTQYISDGKLSVCGLKDRRNG